MTVSKRAKGIKLKGEIHRVCESNKEWKNRVSQDLGCNFRKLPEKIQFFDGSFHVSCCSLYLLSNIIRRSKFW